MIRTGNEQMNDQKDGIIKKNIEYIESRLGNNLENLDSFPRFFLIETIFACNARCIMCPASQSKRTKGRMPKEMILNILDQIAVNKNTVERVQFYLHGEPCLDPDLPEWISAAKSRGIQTTHVSTNGSLLTENMSRRLLDAGLDQVYIAVDAAKDETLASIRIGLDLPTIKKNINQFLTLRDKKRLKTKVRILMVVQEKNISEVNAWFNYWQPRLSRHDELFANRISNWGSQIDTGSFYQPVKPTLPCIYLFGTLPIMADGTIPLCCEDVHPVYTIGHIDQASIADIWNSQQLKRYREYHINGQREQMKLCNKCDVFSEDKYMRRESGLKN